MKKISGYILSSVAIILFLALIIGMLVIKKDYMKYILLVVSYLSVIIFFIGTKKINIDRRIENEKNN